jgi:hypothetical protein
MIDETRRMIDEYNRVAIETEDYILSDPKDLVNIKKKQINDLTVSMRHPHLRLELRGFEDRLYRADDTPISIVTATKIREIINLHRRKYYRITEGVILPTVSLFIPIIALLVAIRSVNYIFIALNIACLLLALLWIVFATRRSLKQHTIIFPKRRANVDSFWNRKGDDILLIVISSIVGAIVGGIITYLFTRFLGP